MSQSRWPWSLVFAIAIATLGFSKPSLGRPVPDETMGEERSRVIDRSPIDFDVDGGARRGRNLFHSFEDFDVDDGGSVYFLNPDGVANIFSRVTGAERSNILGRLGVRGGANLFFMNPNGILFGPNASLDVGGSFVGTTANAIGFGEQGVFSATAPEVPSPLLAVNPSAFLFNQLPQGSITNLSTAGLGAAAGQNLTLLGGNVLFDAGIAIVGDGRATVGGLAAPGTVGLNADGSLQFPAQVARSDVTLLNRAILISLNGGEIQLEAGNVTLSGSSVLGAIATDTADAGDITIDARTINLDRAQLFSNTFTANNGGTITIRATDAVNLANSAEISTSTGGTGDSGSITVRAGNAVNLAGGRLVAQSLSSGRGGDIAIATRQLRLTNGGQINASTNSDGDAGDLRIRATDSIEIVGRLPDSLQVSAIFSRSGRATQVTGDAEVMGDAGDITVETRRLTLRSGGEISTETINTLGNAGNLTIRAGQIELTGWQFVNRSTSNAFLRSSLSTRVDGLAAEVRGGTLTIETSRLRVSDGAVIESSTVGAGGDAGDIVIRATEAIELDGRTGPRNLQGELFSSGIEAGVQTQGVGTGGSIRITAPRLSLSNGAAIDASTFNIGDAGDLTIDADRIELSGINSDGFSTGLLTGVDPTATGNGGNLRIQVDQLVLRDGALISALTLGRGDAGDLTVRANTIQLLGNSANSTSGFVTGVGSEATGDGGNQLIAADRLIIRGGRIESNTSGAGRAGNLTIRANEIQLAATARDRIASGIYAEVEPTASGEGGTIQIHTDRLTGRDGTQVSSSTFGRGNAGDLIVRANEIELIGGSAIGSTNFSTIVAEGATGNGGNQLITADRLTLSGGAVFISSTAGEGRAGDLRVRANQIWLNGTGQFRTGTNSLRQTGSGLYAAVDETATDNGGTIQIAADRLWLRAGATISASTSGRGNAGNIQIAARERVAIDGVDQPSGLSSGIFARTLTSAQGRAGNISLTTPSLRISNGATINAQTFNAFRSGDITINADTLEAINGGQIISNTSSTGLAGNITLTIGDRLLLAGRDSSYAARREQNQDSLRNESDRSGIFANTRANSTGNGGRVIANTANLVLQDGAQISAQSQGQGRAGDLLLNARNQLQLTNSDIVTAAPQASGGDIQINTADGFGDGTIQLRGDSDIITNSLGNGGNITLRAGSILAFDDSDILARSQDARGGNIVLQTPAFFGEGYQVDAETSGELDGNNRVDVNAEGELASGTITTPDTSFIQNSLSDLPETAVDTDRLIANSCIARSESGGTFLVTGTGGLPPRPGDAPLSPYPVGVVQTEPDIAPQPPEAIVEPQGVYRLPDGQLVMSRECR